MQVVLTVASLSDSFPQIGNRVSFFPKCLPTFHSLLLPDVSYFPSLAYSKTCLGTLQFVGQANCKGPTNCKPLQFVGQEAQFKFESKFEPLPDSACHLAISLKAVPEGNRRFRGQNQPPSSWDSSPPLLAAAAAATVQRWPSSNAESAWQRESKMFAKQMQISLPKAGEL